MSQQRDGRLVTASNEREATTVFNPTSSIKERIPYFIARRIVGVKKPILKQRPYYCLGSLFLCYRYRAYLYYFRPNGACSIAIE